MDTPNTEPTAAGAARSAQDVPQDVTIPISSNKRVSNTCVTCRARKVRCDGRRHICSNCERLGFPCSYDDGVGGGFDMLAGAAATSGETGSLSVDGGGSNAHLMHPIPRRRARQACQNCHARKARCSGGTPQCDRCRALGIECIYRPGKRSRMSPVSGSVSGDINNSSSMVGREDHTFERGRSESLDRAEATAPVGSVIFDAANVAAASRYMIAGPCPNEILESLAMRTFDQFFRHIHHIPTFAFLHRASLMQRYRAGLVDRPLLLALVGITSLMTDLGGGPATRELGKQCIAEAEALVLNRLDRPSTLGLQTLVFVIHHRVLSGRFSSAFMLHGVASRFAAALRLNHENPRLCFLARESRRRLMWALYMIDSSMANGYADFSLWAYRGADAMNIQLPCNERNFEFDLPEKTEPLYPAKAPDGSLPPLPDDIGFLALHVRIRSLRGRILQFTKQVTTNLSSSSTADELASIPRRCADIAAELDRFAERLPASFRWSEANVRLRTYSPRLCVFLMTHVWWEQCHCELFRVALAGLQEALPLSCITELEQQFPKFVWLCRRQVFEHAQAMAEMFRLLLTLDNGVPVTDLDLPICLYQCVRLLFYISRTAGSSSPSPPGEEEPIIPHEVFLDLAGVCIRVLDQTITTPATARIRTNLERLMAHGLSAEVAPSGRSTPEVAHMEVDDDDAMVTGLQRSTSNRTLGGGTAVRRTTDIPGAAAMAATASGPSRSAAAQQPPYLSQGVFQTQQQAPPTFDAFDNRMPAASVTASAAGTVISPTDQADPADDLSQSPSGANTATQQATTLDAFDLDVDSFGAVDLGGWFSGDWVTSANNSTGEFPS